MGARSQKVANSIRSNNWKNKINKLAPPKMEDKVQVVGTMGSKSNGYKEDTNESSQPISMLGT